MKKIILSGYYGFNNTGDEAILAALIAGLEARIDELEIIVLSADPQFTTQLHQVEAVNRMNFKRIAQELKKADLLISGGGSLLQDVTSLKTIPYYLGVIVLAKVMKTPVFFCAQGVGPVNNRLNQKLISGVLNKVALITVRDQKSKQLLENWGVKNKITVTADLVFSLELGNEGMINNIVKQEQISFQSPTMGVAVRPWADNSYLNQLAGVLDTLILKLGVNIVLLPFHNPGDREVSQLLKQKMKQQVDLITGDYTPREILALVESCDFFLGVRLHSLIFAALAGIPVAGISYDPKINNFLEQLNLEPVAEIADLEVGVVEEKLIALAKEKDKQLENIQEQLAELKKISKMNFKLLLEELGD
ncbi:polysaccharide pyruvyl transferase CsaB [Halanaerobacter jeridensis]|uniref:Polysaccharide pyruvyl transferase CsaB n=1 Tax=Halanaerobacter jeridensis TaxID=706427 RepID=A0A938XX66_9FIRM|nr:polysaccharide pyruvyl transferase CsaB [Halanaerobacter jeridensis]MBM7557297.1 polysaccharide pyruvyl transferase CsaB [Halanaerobacter jeridensis]